MKGSNLRLLLRFGLCFLIRDCPRVGAVQRLDSVPWECKSRRWTPANIAFPSTDSAGEGQLSDTVQYFDPEFSTSGWATIQNLAEYLQSFGAGLAYK